MRKSCFCVFLSSSGRLQSRGKREQKGTASSQLVRNSLFLSHSLQRPREEGEKEKEGAFLSLQAALEQWRM